MAFANICTLRPTLVQLKLRDRPTQPWKWHADQFIVKKYSLDQPHKYCRIRKLYVPVIVMFGLMSR